MSQTASVTVYLIYWLVLDIRKLIPSGIMDGFHLRQSSKGFLKTFEL